MEEINHELLVKYFQSLSEKLKHLHGFYRMDLSEIKGSFRKGAEYPCMVVESHEGSLAASSDSETVNDRTFAFTIYDNPASHDYDDQNKKLGLCEIVGLKVIARMKKDALTTNHFLYNRFKVKSVSYFKVGPVFVEKLYGYRFVGQISGGESLVVNPADWEDEPEICN